MLSILNFFLYQIETFTYFKTDSNGHTIAENYYYSRLNDNSLYVLICTIVLSVTSYLPFVLLIVVNVLIYVELRHMIARRRNMIGQTTGAGVSGGAVKTDENSSKSASPLTKRESQNVGGVTRLNSDGNEVSLQMLSRTVSNDQRKREAQGKKSLRRSLIMTLWVSLIFSTDRLVKCVYRSVLLFAPLSPVTFYLNACSFVFDALAYSSFFFVYMNTNKIFKRTFYEIFLRKKSNKIN